MRRAVVSVAAAFVVALGLSVTPQAQEKAPGVVILKGSPMGGVKFDHPTHAKAAANKCETCHHASKPQKPLKTAHQKCQDCHAKTVTAPMKTTTKLAFHDNLAKAGICIDCHVKSNAAGKKAPTKCTECHKKENV